VGPTISRLKRLPHLHHHHHRHFICSKTKDVAIQTKDMDVEQDTPDSDKLLRWPLRKEYGNTRNIAIVQNIRYIS